MCLFGGWVAEQASEAVSVGQHRGRCEGCHIEVSYREGHRAVHLLRSSLICCLETLHVQAQHRRQLPYGHLLHGCSLTLTSACDGNVRTGSDSFKSSVSFGHIYMSHTENGLRLCGMYRYWAGFTPPFQQI